MPKEYYSVDKIISIIKNYHWNLRYTQDVLDECTQSVGVAQYGIESVMPKAQGGNVSTVEKQVIRTLQGNQRVAEKLTDMKYLQDRTYRIDDEKDAIILYSVMDGKKIQDIADLLDMTKQGIHYRIERIAYILKGV